MLRDWELLDLRIWEFCCVSYSFSVMLKKWLLQFDESLQMERSVGEIFQPLLPAPSERGEAGGRMDDSPIPGTFNFKSLELLWAGPGCGTPGALQGFMTPFHVIPRLSNPWKKYAGRAGGKGILCFLNGKFSCTLFKHLGQSIFNP